MICGVWGLNEIFVWTDTMFWGKDGDRVSPRQHEAAEKHNDSVWEGESIRSIEVVVRVEPLEAPGVDELCPPTPSHKRRRTRSRLS